MPALSILVPTFRYAPYLRETLDSIVSQDFRDFEVIVADDASGDGTDLILAEYAAKDARFHCHVHPRNLGMVPNWNWCLAQAKAPLIKFMFGDDCFNGPTALGKLVGLMSKHPSATLATSARRLINDRSQTTGRWHHLGEKELLKGIPLGRQCLFEGANLIGEPSAVLFRASALAEGFDDSFRQIVDLELWLRLLTKGDLACSTEELCCFRLHGAQATEVNKRHIGLAKNEHARLLLKHLNTFAPRGIALDLCEERTLFMSLRLFKKAGLSADDSKTLKGFRKQYFSPARSAWLSVLYRVSRMLANLRMGVQKRLGRERQDWNFGSGFRNRLG